MSRTGRPSKINDVVATTTDGRPVTVSERIVDFLRAGNYVETAALATGITKECVYNWLRIGADAGRKQANGRRLTAHERRCLDFSDAVATGQAEAEIRDVTRLAAIAAGGQRVEVATEKFDADGQLVERVVRTQTLEPDARALQWRLERRFARRWGQRGALELTAPDGLPIVLDSDVLVAKLRAAQEAHADELTDDDNGSDGELSDDGNGDDGTPEV